MGSKSAVLRENPASGAQFVVYQNLSSGLTQAFILCDGDGDPIGISGDELHVTGATLQAIQTAVELIDNAISGNEMQVDIVTAPTGTQAQEVQGTAADGAAAVGDPLQVGGKDGSGNIQAVLMDADGHVQVDVLSGGGGVSHVDDAAFTPGTDNVAPVAGVYQSSPDSVDNGDAGALRMTADRALYVTHETPAGDSMVDESNDALKVNIVAGAAGGVSHVDDAAFTVATDDIVPAGGLYQSSRDSVDDGDAGVLAMTAQRALRTVIEDLNGDSAMDESNNALRVNIVAGAGSGGTAMTDDAAFTAGSTSITPAGGVYQSSPDTVDDGDGGALRMTQRRALVVTHETPAGDSMVDDTNDALKVNIVAGSGSGVSHIDDAAFTVGTDDVVPVAGVYQSTPDSVQNNDAGALRMTSTRALYVTHETPDGDSMVDDTNDALKVNIVAGAGSGGTAMTDDAAFTPGSTSITPAGGVYQATPDTVDDGDGGALRMTQRRQLIVSHETPNGDSMIDDTNDALQVNVVAGSAGGTEYTEGNVDATIQGPAMLAEAPSDTVEPLQLNAALDLKVTLDSEVVSVDATGQGDVPVTLAGEAVDISDDATRDLGKVDVADIDGFASVAGQKTKANSFPVTLASDEDALSVDDGGGSLTVDGSVGITGSLPAGTEACL